MTILMLLDKLSGICDADAEETSLFFSYIFNKHSLTLKPCAELGISYISVLILLFTSILSYFSINTLPHIPSHKVKNALILRLFCITATAIVLFLNAFLGIVSSVSISELLIIEYAVIGFAYLTYAAVYILAFLHNAWPVKRSLCISYNISAVILILIGYQRLKVYGFSSIYCYGIEFVVLCHMLSYGLQFFEYVQFRNTLSFEELRNDDDRISLLSDADEGAGIFSKLFFCWVNPLIVRGYNGELKSIANLFRVPPSLKVATIENEFFGNAPDEHVDNMRFSLAVGLLRTFGVQYFSLAILRFLVDCLTFSGPILLHLLVSELQSGDKENYGFVYATLMLLFSFLGAVCAFNFNFYMNKVALKVRCATLVALYDKLLQIPQHQLSNFSSGQLINFMSTDVDRIVSFVTSFHAFWSMPMNILIALYLLYREVGLAFLAGLCCAVLMVPLNKYIANKIGEISQKMMTYKDQRLKMVTEVIRSIRSVKVSNWEPYFAERIDRIRQNELRCLKMRKYLDAVCVYLWASAPLLIIICILTMYTMVMDEKLTPAKVFTSLALVNILIMPLNAFPWVLNSLVEALVSKRRIDKFFDLESMVPNYIYSLIESAEHLLVLENAEFKWSNGVNVGPISLVGKKGMIVGVSGCVGSGKSTLLMGILGEAIVPQNEENSVHGIPLQTTLRIRQTTVNEGFAFVGQDSWVRRGTVRENILCGSLMNESFYRSVLDATALSRDIEKMPGGDQFIIADDGSTLSGGQRARLALARAIYHENDIFLLDDPFASLDRKVGRYVWRNAIEGILRSRGRLVIVATHNTEFLRRTDLLIRLGPKGEIESISNPSEYFPEITEGTERTAEDLGEAPTQLTPLDLIDENSPEALNEEQMETGTVKFDVYWTYLRAVGFALAGAVLFSLLAMQTTKNLADAWLSKWTIQSNDSSATFAEIFVEPRLPEVFLDDDDRSSTRYYLTVFICLAGANTIFTLLRAFLFAHGGVVAARNLHSSLLTAVLRSSVSWWDSTPWGRVVNRLCSDVYMADDALPFQLNIFLATTVNLCGALILSVFALPFLLWVIFVLFGLYYLIQRYYRYTTCEVKRITSLTLSPLYGHITATVTGLVTIRAFRFMPRFMEKLRQLLENNLSAEYSNLAASQWLSIRLQLLGVLMVSAIAFTAVVEKKFFGVESGLIGLAITYALSITGLLNSLLSSFIDTEKELVSVERIVDYVQSIPEEKSDFESESLDRFLYCRSAVGEIDFTAVSLRYGCSPQLALANVTFHIDAGQRVAIIGRTGAGKSSIFQALLRSHPIETGKIFVDSTIDLDKLDPRAVRSMFGVITQIPFLFGGTVRENLCMDIENISDDEIISLIRQAGMLTWLERVGGLDAEVVESGANFSFGERQIVCICRLILSKPKILLIDEATAHMDHHSHTLMMSLIRSRIPSATVLSIMHRTSGLEEFDWIIEMSSGAIARQGTPEKFGYQPVAS